MTEEEKKELEKAQKELETLIEKKVKEGTDASKEEVIKMQNELKTITDSLESIKKEMVETTETIKKLGDKQVTVTNAQKSELEKSLDEIFEAPKFKEFAEGKTKSTGSFELKQISITSDYTGTGHNLNMANNNLNPTAPSPMDSVRQIIPAIDVEAEGMTSYSYLEVNNIDRSAIVVAENGELADSTFKIEEKQTDIKRIGTYLRISKRMLRCITALRQYILQFLQDAMTIAENYQLIFGAGDGYNVKGITKYAPTETEMTGYTDELDNSDFTAASLYTAMDTVASATKTQFTFNTAIPNVNTGMKVVIASVVNATSYNATFEVEKVDDHTIVIPAKYTSSVPATDFANATFKFKYDFADSKDFANKLDAVESIIAFQTFGQFRPNGLGVNPLELDKWRGIKDSVGRKLFGDYVQGNTINGVTIFESSAIPMGKVLVGDFVRGCKILDCLKTTLEFAEDRESKRKNFVELIAQEELMFAVEVPQAFMYADLATVVAYIDSGKVFNVAISSPLNTAGDAIQMEEKTA